jgi:hypothetical protein
MPNLICDTEQNAPGRFVVAFLLAYIFLIFSNDASFVPSINSFTEAFFREDFCTVYCVPRTWRQYFTSKRLSALQFACSHFRTRFKFHLSVNLNRPHERGPSI